MTRFIVFVVVYLAVGTVVLTLVGVGISGLLDRISGLLDRYSERWRRR